MKNSKTLPQISLPQAESLAHTSYHDALVSSGSVESHFSISNAQRRTRQYSSCSSTLKPPINRTVPRPPSPLNEDMTSIKPNKASANLNTKDHSLSPETVGSSEEDNPPTLYQASHNSLNHALLESAWRNIMLTLCLACMVVLSIDIHGTIMCSRGLHDVIVFFVVPLS
jgi:hypothetical protein